MKEKKVIKQIRKQISDSQLSENTFPTSCQIHHEASKLVCFLICDYSKTSEFFNRRNNKYISNNLIHVCQNPEILPLKILENNDIMQSNANLERERERSDAKFLKLCAFWKVPQYEYLGFTI